VNAKLSWTKVGGVDYGSGDGDRGSSSADKGVGGGGDDERGGSDSVDDDVSNGA
jgi:hypothetical protein